MVQLNNTAPTSFTDSAGQDWQLRFTLRALESVRKEFGVDFSPSADGQAFLVLSRDPLKLGAVLWTLCESQADNLGVSPEQFAERFDGPTLDAAYDALVAASIELAPRGMRPHLKASIDRALSAQQLAMREAVERFDVEAFAERSAAQAIAEAEAKLDELIGTQD